MNRFSEETALRVLENGYVSARETIQNQDEFERFLQRLEKKLRDFPGVGGALAEIPILLSLLKSYAKKEYTIIPLGSIVAVVSAFLYFISPIDLLPDVLPGIGYLDDAAVIAGCLKLIASDLEEYKEWRRKTGRLMEV